MSTEPKRWRPELEFEKRNITIDGTPTTLSMEKLFWAGLEGIAKRNGVSWKVQINAALAGKPGRYESRAGWLRIWIFAHFHHNELLRLKRLVA